MDINSKAVVDGICKVVKEFVEKKLAPVDTEIGLLKAREETHFQTVEALLRRVEALERKSGQKSGGAVRLIGSDR